ncbi:MAG: hypothetical protein HKN87_05430 [Saprospiraceae bacterium]|nr:hypothetical protein [Saprospiraceae bacterium]
MQKLKRILGSYTQGLNGPLLLCVGGLHGNEWAGIKALDLIMKMLEVEPITNPSFKFFGKMVCFMGNLPALKAGKRYIRRDLNRLWKPEHLKRLRDPNFCRHDVREMAKLKQAIDREIRHWEGDEIYLIDLHTTTATGGIFCLPVDTKPSIEVAKEMNAPVILGLVERLEGTMLQHYTIGDHSKPIKGVVFESGQHYDPLSINRSIAGVINCMRTVGSVLPEHVVNRHDQLLISYSKGLPKVARLIYAHRIKWGDRFVMQPGYENFQMVRKGELLAKDRHGEIRAVENGLMLMPHYQKQGNDGFFLVHKIS